MDRLQTVIQHHSFNSGGPDIVLDAKISVKILHGFSQ